jgi:hypothetical protein
MGFFGRDDFSAEMSRRRDLKTRLKAPSFLFGVFTTLPFPVYIIDRFVERTLVWVVDGEGISGNGLLSCTFFRRVASPP